jgi:hypothetical protein
VALDPDSPLEKQTALDTSIEGLEVDTLIGAYDWERTFANACGPTSRFWAG